jgi:hypothetical protein
MAPVSLLASGDRVRLKKLPSEKLPTISASASADRSEKALANVPSTLNIEARFWRQSNVASE